MRIYETFRRVSAIHESRGYPAYRLSRRDAETRNGVSKTGGRESESAWAKTWEQKTKAKDGHAAFRFRPRGNRNLEYRLRYFVLLRRQFRIGQSLANDLRAQTAHSFPVVYRGFLGSTVVIPKHLFVYVPEQVERLNRYIGAIQSTLQETPEVFHSVDVDAATNVALSLVNNLMDVSQIDSAHVRNRVIGINLCAVLHLLENFRLQSLSLNVRHDSGAYLPRGTVKNPLHDGLTLCAALCFIADLLAK